MGADQSEPGAESMVRQTLRILVMVGATAGAASCAHQAVEPDAPSGVMSPDPGSASGGRQALLRARYRGLDGRGRVRLTVRTLGGKFQLVAADAFGRQLWTFSGDARGSRLLDHRRREVCELPVAVAVPAIALADLPVTMLPAVLLGDLPFALEGGGTGQQIERSDDMGRRWTGTLDEHGRPRAWTLWRDDRPLVWWQATEDGAILSHREGAQVLWTVVADEPLPGPLPKVDVPDGYASGNCDAQGLS